MIRYLIGAAFALGMLIGVIVGALAQAVAEVHGIDGEDKET